MAWFSLLMFFNRREQVASLNISSS